MRQHNISNIATLHDNKVKANITVGNSGSADGSVYVGSNQSVSLRATTDVLLLDGFEVGTDSEFYATNNPCQ